MKLGEEGDERAAGPLIAVLKDDEHPYARGSAAVALGDLGVSRAIDPLIAVLKDDEHPYVRESAVGALEKTTGRDFGEDPEKWQQWWKDTKDTFVPRDAPKKGKFPE